jgi:hypothetical protein
MTFKNTHGLLSFTCNGKDKISDKGGTFELSETDSYVDTLLAKGMIEVITGVSKQNTK